MNLGVGNSQRTHLAGVGAISVDKTYLLQEWITPLERRLYFTTAHAHFLAGCPALALEVLSKLPDHVQPPDSDVDKVAESTVDGMASLFEILVALNFYKLIRVINLKWWHQIHQQQPQPVLIGQLPWLEISRKLNHLNLIGRHR